MSKIVCLLGAGVNKSIKNWDGLSPPTINDFFEIALQMRKYRDEHYSKKVQIVYDYIQRYWKKDVGKLATSSFDLEESFTLLEGQADEALHKNDAKEYKRLELVQFLLKSFLAEVLQEFETFASVSDTMRSFGQVLYAEQPTIITFNYDCLLEAAIESASGVNLSIPEEMFKKPSDNWPFERIKVQDEELAYSHHNWNRPLGYGITFDEVELHRAGLRTFVAGNRFYSHHQNKLYSWPILKLHGSLNWFRYLPIRSYPTFSADEPQLGELENKIILVRGRWWFGTPPDMDGYVIDPIIITPVLYKEKFYRQPIFEYLWERAKYALSECERLVIIGYSFSATDFSTRRLFREAFSNHDAQELVIVNPNSAVVEIAKDLCHYERDPVTYRNLEEFLSESL